MEEFNNGVRKIVRMMEELAGMIVDNPSIEEYFAEEYQENCILDYPLWYVADYVKETIIAE